MSLDYEVKSLPLSDIDTSNRRRQVFGDLHELAHSIKQHGLLHPVVVLRLEDGKYRLLAGERRFRAVELLKETEIPANIVDREISDKEIKVIELIENVQRLDLTWQERVALEREIHETQQEIHGVSGAGGPRTARSGWSLDQTAEMLGASKSTVQRDIFLAAAAEKIPQVAKCKTASDAEKLLKKYKGQLAAKEQAIQVQKKMEGVSKDSRKTGIINGYILGEFPSAAEALPSGTIDLVDFDPPWPIQLAKNTLSTLREASIEGYVEGYDREQYPTFLLSALRECFRLMKPNSWIILWSGAETELMYLSWQKLVEAGFTCNGIPCIWNKMRKGQSINPEKNLANSYEAFLYGKKGMPTIRQVGRSNVFDFKPVSAGSKSHKAEKPIEFMEELLQTFVGPGARVLVPCLGSGNTMLAAANLAMGSFGYELTEDFRNQFILRVNQGEPGKYKSYKPEDQDV